MPIIKCPGCGADIDTESGRAEYSAPATISTENPKSKSVDATDQPGAEASNRTAVSVEVEHKTEHPHKPSRFWRRDD